MPSGRCFESVMECECSLGGERRGDGFPIRDRSAVDFMHHVVEKRCAGNERPQCPHCKLPSSLERRRQRFGNASQRVGMIVVDEGVKLEERSVPR
jgi:hypothetical protein